MLHQSFPYIILAAARKIAVRQNPGLGVRQTPFARWAVEALKSALERDPRGAVLWAIYVVAQGHSRIETPAWLPEGWRGTGRKQARDGGGWPVRLAEAIVETMERLPAGGRPWAAYDIVAALLAEGVPEYKIGQAIMPDLNPAELLGLLLEALEAQAPEEGVVILDYDLEGIEE